jgi:hypothetical protein
LKYLNSLTAQSKTQLKTGVVTHPYSTDTSVRIPKLPGPVSDPQIDGHALQAAWTLCPVFTML